MLKKMYTSIMWKKHVLSDLCNTYIFKSKKKAMTSFGFNMVSRNYIANKMMLEGTFEKNETTLIKSFLNSSDIFIDVGANIGFYTCLAKSLSKHVLAFEPQPQNLECLYSNLSSNGWSDTEVYPIGLSSKIDLLTLYGASGPSASLVKGWAGYSAFFKRIIPVNTMDNILSNRFDKKKLFIKIDVEGAEYAVLQGAKKILCRDPKPTWFIEICLNEFYPGKINPNYEKTFNFFLENGYRAHLANKDNNLISADTIKKWVSNKKTDTNEFNYIFIPEK